MYGIIQYQHKVRESEGMRILTSCGCGVIALAITPPGVFGDLPVFGKASNRGSRRGC